MYKYRLSSMKKFATLEEIIPDKPEFYVSAKKKTYSLRPPNIEDQAWFISRFGSLDKVTEAMTSQDWEGICKIVYRLICNEGKRDFKAEETTEFDDDGVETTALLPASRALLRSLIPDEALEMMRALTKAVVLSNPLIEKAVVDNLKKNSKDIAPWIGEKSSIKSKANMDGQKNKSRISRHAT